MNQVYTLQFCKICKNRSFSFNEGIICKLTNEKAVFENSCPSFEKDESEVSKLLEAIEAKQWDEDGLFYPTSRMDIIKPDNLSEVHFKNSSKYYGSLTILTLLIFVVTLHAGFTDSELNYRLLMYTISASAFAGLIYSLRQYLNKKIRLTFNLKGIEIEGDFINWFEILDASINSINHKYGVSEFLILYLLSGKEKRIELHTLDNNSN